MVQVLKVEEVFDFAINQSIKLKNYLHQWKHCDWIAAIECNWKLIYRIF